MTPDATLTIPAEKSLTTQTSVSDYLDTLVATHDCLRHYRYALIDVVNTNQDDTVEIYNVPAMDGGFVSSTNGIRLLWMPEIGRAALNGYQGGDWQWTDAHSPEDALRRYRDDEMTA